MPNSNLPLSWESTGDQWWYATPIDWAAANGMCDLVKELLCIDPNLLIKLTSLARIRRLETVWDDNLRTCNEIARCRARVARTLLLECVPKNALIRAGYGGWLLYTASSAGDMAFVKDLLARDPLAVFGEGEYAITDILYAAARSRNSEVFRLLFEYSMSVKKGSCGVDGNFVDEMMSRAVHAAARGGNLEILKELLLDCADVLAFRDGQSYTILHSAASRGQVEVVAYLVQMYDITTVTDNQGNTALHVAAYKGYSSAVETLALASPFLATSRNNNGDTFLHMAVAGFRSPGFHRIDHQIELMKQLVSSNILNLENVINITNNDGKTALHIAVAGNIPSNVVDLLMRVPSVYLNIRDIDGLSPLDLLKQYPKTAASESATKNANFAQSTIYGIGTSPGTSFRVLDADLLSCTGDANYSDISGSPTSRFSSCSSELTTSHSTKSASKRLTSLLQWPKKLDGAFNQRKSREKGDKLVSLRQRFLTKGVFPSPSTKEKFAAGLMQGVIQAKLPLSAFSPSTPNFDSFAFSPSSVDRRLKSEIFEGRTLTGSKFFSGPLNGGRSVTMDDKHRRVSSFSKSMMNQYFCFGAQGVGVAVEEPVSYNRANRSCRRLVF